MGQTGNEGKPGAQGQAVSSPSYKKSCIYLSFH